MDDERLKQGTYLTDKYFETTYETLLRMNGELSYGQKNISFVLLGNWTNKNSRSSIEMSDLSSRPEIADKVENMDEYDEIKILQLYIRLYQRRSICCGSGIIFL